MSGQSCSELPLQQAVEQVRVTGKAMGLWRHGYDYQHRCRQIFGDLELKGKTILEIGCGNGITSVWASIHGAKHVVGLEPQAAGSPRGARWPHQFFQLTIRLQLRNMERLPHRIQDFAFEENYFDLVLSYASINHWDEESCMALPRERAAKESYLSILKRVRSLMKNNGTIIVIDAANRNLFGDLRLRNPFTPTIDWPKHQSPGCWVSLLSEAGFADPRVSWLSGRALRYLGVYTTSRAISYLAESVFRLEMRCCKARMETGVAG